MSPTSELCVRADTQASVAVGRRARLARSLGIFCSREPVHISRVGERTAVKNLSFGITLTQRAGTPLDQHRLSACHVHHGRLVGSANLALDTPTRPLTAHPVHLPASPHQLALTATISRPAARQNQPLMAVLAIPARPRQRRPMRSAAAVW